MARRKKCGFKTTKGTKCKKYAREGHSSCAFHSGDEVFVNRSVGQQIRYMTEPRVYGGRVVRW